MGEYRLHKMYRYLFPVAKGGKNAKKLSFCRFLLFCICVFATLFVSLPCVLGRIVFHSKNRSSYEQDYILLFPCGRIVVCPCC